MAFIVPAIFRITVVQVTVADDYRLYMYACIVTVYGSQCECFLLYLGKVTQYVFCFFSVQFGVEAHIVYACQAEHK